ncbi:MAG TPA: response regulator [Bacteroidota bacterium]|nr:response regulator [Bacteroidota bacterium]
MTAKVLVVDDDQYIRVILQKKFLSQGYTVFLANDGEEGLAVAKKETPNLIVSDWMMPRMDGLEFCRLAKQDEKLRFTYFILLTARDTQDDKIEGIEIGADDFVTKPFNDRELLTRVRAGLRINALQKENAHLQHQKAITELAMTLGHEINNPLGIMMLVLQVLQKKSDTDTIAEIRKELRTVAENGNRIAEIVKKLSNLDNPRLMPYLKNSETKMVDLSGKALDGK